jgi:hypothetical protein
MNGTGSSFTDSSGTPKTITAVGNVTQSTVQSKFGGKSAVFDGDGDRLTIPGSTAFYFGSGDYTVEAWLYIVTLNAQGGGNFFSQSRNFTDNQNRQYAFRVGADGLAVYWTTTGANDTTVAFPTTPPTNQWFHVAFTRSSNILRAFVDGTKVGSDVAHTPTYFNSTANVCVGSFGEYGLSSLDFAGYIDELRVTKGVARYTASFTPPSSEFLDF